jgi:hypothetical protein
MRIALADDFVTEPPTDTPQTLADYLDSRIQEALAEIEASPVWALVVSPSTPLTLIQETLKEIYLEIAMYQPDSIEAAIASIAQMPRRMAPAFVDAMLHHQVEEFDHGEMALRDYVACGGDEDFARSRPQSPSAFAVAAIWRNIAHKRDPFLYLGAVYLFDALTPIVTERAMKLLANRGLSGAGLEFISHHATADIEHAESIRNLIVDVTTEFPEARRSVVYGFEYFKHVYPLPCWESARRRAERRVQSFAEAAE